MSDKSTKPEQTLTEALDKVGQLEASMTKLQGQLDAANARADKAESDLKAEQAAHNSTKSELEAAQNSNQDFEKSVAARAAQIAQESGVEAPPPADAKSSDAESMEEIVELYNKADCKGKAALLEKYGEKIMKA